MEAHMPKVYPLDVESIVTDDGSTVGYMTKGHHDPQEFIDDLRAGWDQDADPKDISRGYWRVLPPDAEGFKSYQESCPGPGAFPVTYTYEAGDYVSPEDAHPDEYGAALAQAQEHNERLHRVWDVLGAGWAYADHLLACASLQWPPSVCDCGYTEMESSIERVLAAALAPEQESQS